MTQDKIAAGPSPEKARSPEARSEPIRFNGILHMIEYWRDSTKPGEVAGGHLVNERDGRGAFRIVPVDSELDA